MMVEFYGNGRTAPSEFDIFLHSDGTTSYSHSKTIKKQVVRVVVELSGKRTSVFQKNAIYGLISKHKVCTVAFYDLEN